jgi:hypothetical protein
MHVWLRSRHGEQRRHSAAGRHGRTPPPRACALVADLRSAPVPSAEPSDVDWSAYDFIALVQLTVDTIALSSGLDGNLGAPREFVLIEMTRTAAAMAPQRPTDEHAHVAVHVLDHLLRHDKPTPYFAVGYADPDVGWQTATRSEFVLVDVRDL